MASLYLASASARRRELLAQMGVPFASAAVAIDESPCAGEDASRYVERLSLCKAQTAAARLPEGAVVLGADTCVVLDGAIIGKPRDRAHGLDILMALSGRRHQVLTGVALVQGARQEVCVVASEVLFRPLSPTECAAYWDTGEPIGKAGGYAIQGLAGVFVRHLSGSYSSVVGLPLCETAELLERFAISCWQSTDEAP